MQGLDRYAYVNNNPLVYTDPSGHFADCGRVPDGYARQQCERASKNEQLYNAFLEENWELFDTLLGIMLTTDGTTTWDTTTWNGVTFNEAVAVRRGAMDVAFALGSVNHLSAAEAFREAFGTSASDRLEFRRVASFTYDANQDGVLETYTAGGVTRSRHLIVLANLSNWNFGTARNNVVHELGHAFNVAHGRHPQNFAGRYLGINAKLLRPFDTCQWQLRSADNASEMFADMFIAWTYNAWNTYTDENARLSSAARAAMTTKMSEWLY